VLITYQSWRGQGDWNCCLCLGFLAAHHWEGVLAAKSRLIPKTTSKASAYALVVIGVCLSAAAWADAQVVRAD
jgi:hypothetical protein